MSFGHVEIFHFDIILLGIKTIIFAICLPSAMAIAIFPEGRLPVRHARHVDGPEGEDDAHQGSSENIQWMMEVVTDPGESNEESQNEETKLDVGSDNLEQ